MVNDTEKEFVQQQVLKLIEQSKNGGILWPFLFKKATGEMIAARPISTKRDDALNVCWACVQPVTLRPNGIFFSFNEEEQSEVETRYLRFSTQNIGVGIYNGGHAVNIRPSIAEYAAFFQENKAIFLKDKRELR